MSSPRVETKTGQKVIAIYGSQLFDDVLGIEAELRAEIAKGVERLPGETTRMFVGGALPMTLDNSVVISDHVDRAAVLALIRGEEPA